MVEKNQNHMYVHLSFTRVILYIGLEIKVTHRERSREQVTGEKIT